MHARAHTRSLTRGLNLFALKKQFPEKRELSSNFSLLQTRTFPTDSRKPVPQHTDHYLLAALIVYVLHASTRVLTHLTRWNNTTNKTNWLKPIHAHKHMCTLINTIYTTRRDYQDERCMSCHYSSCTLYILFSHILSFLAWQFMIMITKTDKSTAISEANERWSQDVSEEFT